MRDLPADGDVERNPGPPTVGFLEFSSSHAVFFLQAADANTLARHCIDLRHRAASWPTDWLTTLFCTPQLSASEEECVRVVAAFEVYANQTLEWGMEGPQWCTVDDPVVRELRERLRQLELRASPPTEEELAGAPTADKVERFLSLGGLAPWLAKALGVYRGWARQSDMPTQGAELWACLVQAHFRPSPGAPQGGVQGGRASQQNTRSRPAGLSLADLNARGGVVENEICNGAMVTWGTLDGIRYYVSKKGALWDIRNPPPGPCFTCGGQHWYWQCPATAAPGRGGGPTQE